MMGYITLVEEDGQEFRMEATEQQLNSFRAFILMGRWPIGYAKVRSLWGLRVRKEPSTTAPIVKILALNTEVIFYEYKDTPPQVWVKVDGGWVCCENNGQIYATTRFIV